MRVILTLPLTRIRHPSVTLAPNPSVSVVTWVILHTWQYFYL